MLGDRIVGAVWTVPSWELLVHPPAVFVRVANTGLAGYGTWKCVRKMGDEVATAARRHREESKRAPGRRDGQAAGLKDMPREPGNRKRAKMEFSDHTRG